MNREVLIALIDKDIRELAKLTDGFSEMREFPAPYMELAIDKANALVENLVALSAAGRTAHADDVAAECGESLDGCVRPVVISPVEPQTFAAEEAEGTQCHADMGYGSGAAEIGQSVRMAKEEAAPVTHRAGQVSGMEEREVSERTAAEESAVGACHDDTGHVNGAAERERREQDAGDERAAAEEMPEEDSTDEQRIGELAEAAASVAKEIEEIMADVEDIAGERQDAEAADESIYTEESGMSEPDAEAETADECEMDATGAAERHEAEPAEDDVERRAADVAERVQPVTTVADALRAGESLHDSLTKGNDDTIAATMAAKKITELKSALTIADRFRFQRELFGGDGEKMMQALSDLDAAGSIAAAKEYVRAKFSWKADDPCVVSFMTLLERRYM